MNTLSRICLFCFFILILAGCDRATKNIAKHELKDKEAISILHDSFRLEYVENTGAAMSLGDALPRRVSFWILSVLPLCFLMVLLVYVLRDFNSMSSLKLLSFALILAGGMGNIIDRIQFDRHVTDFMNIGIGNIRSGIFNFADVYVSAGVVLLLLSLQNNKKKLQPEALTEVTDPVVHHDHFN